MMEKTSNGRFVKLPATPQNPLYEKPLPDENPERAAIDRMLGRNYQGANALHKTVALKKLRAEVDRQLDALLERANKEFDKLSPGVSVIEGCYVQKFTTRKKWKFPEYVEKLTRDLAKAKEKAVDKGEVIDVTPKFNPAKNSKFAVTVNKDGYDLVKRQGVQRMVRKS